MKYLEVSEFSLINDALIWETPESKIHGKLEAYSCKSAGSDKKLLKQLETRYALDMGNGSVSPTDDQLRDIISPLGSMDQSSSRKILFYLIGTLNLAWPDYDFSEVNPHQFDKQSNVSMVINSINTSLYNMGNERIYKNLGLWQVVDSIINLDDCVVYSYNPNDDDDPVDEESEENAMFSMNYFFFNRKMKRMVYFTVRSISPNADTASNEDLEGRIDAPSDDLIVGELEL
ncbi:hypothetical protein BZG36_01270 [Bifiguratus adelaidae]|uniref:Repressor of RNA polymerase III transcription MAF1 n=1 Tax=Bifiguratus adelaidae TaxID=1938954 RepID=A0A261Y5P7_9FUNG|nr:hypothetical protein BZG36_01270 [Bifiguratus adelaidae]